MPATPMNLKAGGGRPAIEIIVGNLHRARFDVSLFDASGSNPQTFGAGLNTDNIPDIFPLPGPTVSALDGTTIFWRTVISSPTGLPNETFSVTVRIIQDGKVMGSETRTGLVTDLPPEGFIRLHVS